MNERRITITLIDGRKNIRWFATLFGIVFSVCGPIMLGVLLDSTAMQWVGFLFGMLCIVAIIYRDSRSHTFDNVEAAKRRLDEWEEGK